MKCVYPDGLELTKEKAIAFENACSRLIEAIKIAWQKIKEIVLNAYQALKRLFQKDQSLKRNSFVKRRSQTRKIKHQVVKHQVINKRTVRYLARSNC